MREKAAWLFWLAALAVGLRGGTVPLGTRIWGLGLATLVILAFTVGARRWAQGLTMSAALGQPSLPAHRPARPWRPEGSRSATLSGSGLDRLRTWVGLALGSRRFLEAEFAAYLDSLSQGMPITQLLWARGHDDGAKTLAPDGRPTPAPNRRPGPTPARRPGPEELRRLIERTEESYEHRRRSAEL